MVEAPLEDKLRRRIYELASTLQVNKDKKFDSICVRDKESGAVVCARKKYLSDSTHAISGYAKIGGTRVVAVGDSKDIKELEETIGP